MTTMMMLTNGDDAAAPAPQWDNFNKEQIIHQHKDRAYKKNTALAAGGTVRRVPQRIPTASQANSCGHSLGLQTHRVVAQKKKKKKRKKKKQKKNKKKKEEEEE